VEKLYDAVARLQNLLSSSDVASALIGGLAVPIWGVARLTRDADLKVMLSRDEATRLLTILPAELAPTTADPEAALRGNGILFVIHPAGFRIDLALADTPYDELAIQRAKPIEVQPGLVVTVCSPEDLIIYKSISTRARDYDDAVSVIRRQGEKLDDKYVLHWLRQFELALDDSTLVATYKKLRKLK
jgi:hypothetical protein